MALKVCRRSRLYFSEATLMRVSARCERVLGAVVVDLGIVALQPLFGARLRFSARGDVDFLRALGGLGEDRDLVRQHFGKSPRHGKRVAFAADL